VHGTTLTATQTPDSTSADGADGSVTLATPAGSVTVSYGGTNSYNGNAAALGVTGVQELGLIVTSTTDPNINANNQTYQGEALQFGQQLGLNYANFGLFEIGPCANEPDCSPTYVGVLGGAQNGQSLTAVGAIPTTGYASYWGAAVGYFTQAATINNTSSGAFYGTFGLTANFANNQITGAITNIQAYSNILSSGQNLGTLNDITFTATISGNTYNGTVTPSSVTTNTTNNQSGNSPTYNISGATGQLVGGFYGPAAQETAGTFYLTGGTNATELVGSFGGAAGSDSGNQNLTATHFVSIDTVSGSPGNNLDLSPDGIGTSLFQKTIDSSPDGFTKLVTYNTPGGVIVVEEGGAQQYAANQTRDGQTGVEGGNLIILSSTDPAVTTAGGGNWEAFGAVVGLKYADFGIWNISPTGNNAGSQTPLYVGAGGGAKAGHGETSTMPTTGSATYTGGAAGYVVKGGTGGEFYGTSSLTANFATGGGTVTGSISNINVYSFNNNALMGTMNSISISATISGAGNSAAEYSGTTSAQAGAGTAFDITGATGSIKGGFYGPSAQETAGTFQMSGGGAQIVGSFGAKTAAPSDRRLKLDIAPAGHLANGLALYSWRYLGGRHRFTGVMAQDLLADRRFAAAVIIAADGLMRVDYARIGYIPHDLATMTAEGEAAVRRYRATVH